MNNSTMAGQEETYQNPWSNDSTLNAINQADRNNTAYVESEDGKRDVIVLAGFFLAICTCFGLLLLVKLVHWWRQSPDETEEEKERREAHRHGKKTMKDERREFVKKNLKTEIFIPSNADIEVGVPRPTDENDLNSCCIDNEVGTHRPGAGEKEGTGDGVVSIESCGTDLEDDDEEDDEEDCQKRPTCAICLEAFKAGDKVSSSHNMKCTHVFHRECVFEWLVKEESCPFCRRKFITQCRWM